MTNDDSDHVEPCSAVDKFTPTRQVSLNQYQCVENMAIHYNFEIKSAANTERLVADCVADARLQSDIFCSACNTTLSKGWAVNDSYENNLLVLPEIVREESGQYWYLFLWHGIVFRFATLTLFGTLGGDPISFAKPLELSQSELNDFLCDLKNAFATYGRFGAGPEGAMAGGDRVNPVVTAES